jgi:hypothetical protein
MSDDALTVLTQSYNPVSFTTEGMRGKDGGMSYKVGSHATAPPNKVDGKALYSASSMTCCCFSQISEKDIRTLKKLGQGASSIVRGDDSSQCTPPQ